MASVADTVLFPLQDVLGLGSEARMNTPAVPSGNWRWRFRAEIADAARSPERLKDDGVRRMTDKLKAPEFLADLEHELRLPRHPVRLGLADGQHERHLRIPGRARRPDPDPVAGRAADGIDRAADHRACERPHLEPAGPAASLLSDRRDAQFAALILMPRVSALWMAAGLLWILDASINISMEPFRAFVADMLPEDQRTRGFAMQSLFIGLGAVVASALPGC